MKTTYKYIKRLQDITDWDNGVFEYDEQVNGEQIAYFTPASANWSYRVELVKRGGELYEVVTVFGGVKAYRQLFIPEV